MNNISREIKNEDGTSETLSISSEDHYDLKLDKNYVIANHRDKVESKIAKKFKSSILGSDIGIKSGGFSSVAILATVISLSAILVMYFMWKF